MSTQHVPKTALTLKDRQNARELALCDMLDWYLQESGGRMPEELVRNPKAFRKEIEWWFEPLIPGQVNPLLREYFEGGDKWTLKLEPIEPKITNLRPR